MTSLILIVVGVLLGPVLRAQIARFSIADGTAWRTRCDACGRPLGLALPVTGRCPTCQKRIGPAPGVIELVVGVGLALVVLRLRGTPLLPVLAVCWLVLIGTVLAFVDLAVERLPNRLTAAAVAGVVVLLGAAAFDENRPGRLVVAVICGLISAAAYLVLAIFGPMGMGDVKLAVALGAILGWWGGRVTLLGIAAGFLVYGLLGVVLLATRRVGRRDQLPHGPAMLIGALGAIAILAG